MSTPSFEIIKSDGNGGVWIKPTRPPVYLTITLVINKDGVASTEHIEGSLC